MDLKKSTHKEYRTEMFIPIMKNAKGNYIAVLSDNSVDRDEESISKECIRKLADDDGYLAALLNHDNDIMNLVAEWTNKGCQEIDGYTALIAEPKFYESNPKAKIIKGMIDEGAKPGISIGAIVKNYEDINNKRVFTELELVEASFVAIPSNRHGRAMAVAKSFNKPKKEGSQMDKQFTQKDLDSQIEKKVEEINVDFQKQLESKNEEIVKIKSDLQKAIDDVTKEKEKVEKKVKELEATVEKQKNEAVEKMKFTKDQELKEEKSFSEGHLPIMRY